MKKINSMVMSMSEKDPSKEELIQAIDCLMRDDQAFVEKCQDLDAEFDDPWDVHCIENWETRIYELERIKNYILKH